VAHVGDKTGCGTDRVDETLGLRLGEGRGPPAPPADQMLMTGIFGKVVDRRAVAEMRMGEKPGLFQRLQGPVHGGAVESGPALRPGPVVHVGGAEMLVVGGCDHLAHGTAGLGDSITLLTQGVDQLVCRYVHSDRLSAGPEMAGRCR